MLGRAKLLSFLLDCNRYGHVTLQQGHNIASPVDHWLSQYYVNAPRALFEDEANYELLKYANMKTNVEPWLARQSAWQSQVGGAAGESRFNLERSVTVFFSVHRQIGCGVPCVGTTVQCWTIAPPFSLVGAVFCQTSILKSLPVFPIDCIDVLISRNRSMSVRLVHATCMYLALWRAICRNANSIR